MPSQRPSAAFDPLPPDLDLAALVEETPNFEYVTRVSCEMIDSQGMEQFERLVLLHVILGGKPLVIEGFQRQLDEWTFTSQWLRDNCGSKFESARNLGKQQFLPLSIGHYLNNLSKLTNQWTSTNYRDPDRQRIYLKDIDSPDLWREKLESHIPPSIYYLNESTGDYGGPGALDILPTKKLNITKGRGIARAGDLMSSLPAQFRADNLMCYIGHEGTYTPAHREMCASLGQNLMVETSGTVDEEGKPAKPGSSIWFMTETNDRHLVSEYWLSTLGHDIEVEKHFAQVNALKAAPFTTYVVEQRVGDFILIPPLAAHQVWNRGTRTMKVAWNRTTIETLEMALHEALPRARMVCRDEQYKNKAIVYFTLQKYSALLDRIDALKHSESDEQTLLNLSYNTKIRQLQKDFKRLFALYAEILLSEMLAPVFPGEKKGQYLPYEGFVTCSYCRCNIFNRFLTCESCIEPLENGEESTYDICMDCFAMGRSCKCISNFKWVEQFPWQELTERHEKWRHMIIALEGGMNETSPRSLQREKKSFGRKTLAQVCQEQLKLRPWNDPQNPRPVLTTAEMNNKRSGRDNARDDDDDDQQRSRKKGAAKLEPGFVIEHVGCHPREAWKCATCAKCNRSFQYGSLWRMFDLMPQTIMEQYEWECPVCQKFCSCGACRRKADIIPYEPRGTVLGHDTRKVADARSVENLVDFSMSNLHHIKKADDDDPLESRRLERRIDEAARAKAQDPDLRENYVEGEDLTPEAEQFYKNGIRYTTEPDIPIDPMLSVQQPAVPTTNDRMQQLVQSQSRKNGEMVTAENGHHPKQAKKTQQRNQKRTKEQPQSHRDTNKVQTSASMSSQAGGIPPVASMHRGEKNSIENDPDDGFADHPYPEPPVSDFAIPNTTTGEGSSNDVSLYHQAQVDQSLQEARQKNRYIIAEAALRGRSLPVTLRIGTLGVALMADRMAKQSTAAPQGSRDVDKELLQSDVPATNQSVHPLASSKKRKIRDGEVDADFTTRKRKDRKGDATRVPQTQPDGHMENNGSDSASESEVDGSSFLQTEKSRGPRKLPKYLADQHEDGDLLAELPPDLPRKRLIRAEKSGGSGAEVGSQSSATKHAAKAQEIAEENKRAKRKSIGLAERNANGAADSENAALPTDVPPQSVLKKAKESLMKVPQSMFSRMAGRKIKIVGAKKNSIKT